MRVLIVGAGVAGCTLAIVLQRAGISCEIFEQSRQPGSGIALIVAANGVSVLRSLGLLDQVDACSVRISSSSFENDYGSSMASARDPHAGEITQTRAITRPRLQQILEHAATDAGAVIHYGKQLIAIEQTVSTVTATFADGTQAVADALIGADGIGSRVRQIIFPEVAKLQYTGMIAYAGISPCYTEVLTGCQQQLHFLYGRNAFFEHVDISTSTGPGTLWWSTFGANLEPRDVLRQRAINVHRRNLLAVHKGWSPLVHKLIHTAPAITPLAVHRFEPLERWSLERVALIGDAAHAIGPHAGQASSIAMEDAFTLGSILPEASTLQEAFTRFEYVRRPRVDRVVAIGSRSESRKTETSAIRHWLRLQSLRIRVPLGSRRDNSWLLEPSLNS